MMPTIDFNALMDNRSDPDVRMVLEDAELSMGRLPVRLGLALSIASYAYSDADGVATAADVDVDSDDSAVVDADADAADDAYAADAARAARDDGAAAFSSAANIPRLFLLKEIDTCNGLKIVQVPGLYDAVTRIGWVRRVSGDEYEIINARTIHRTGTLRTLDSLASDGPRDDHTLTPPAKATEELHRLTIRSSTPADVGVWAEHCPQPKDWKDG